MDISKLRQTFSKRIQKLRKKAKLNQSQFADSVGVSRGAMSYYEQEMRTPDIGVLKAICEKYKVSADYLIGLIPDENHAISDVCQMTGLSPNAVKRLNLLKQMIDTEFDSNEDMTGIFGENFLELAPHTSVIELLNTLLENGEYGMNVLTMLGAIILGAEVDSGGNEVVLQLKSASKNFKLTYPVENMTSVLWENVRENALMLKKEIAETNSSSKEETGEL